MYIVNPQYKPLEGLKIVSYSGGILNRGVP